MRKTVCKRLRARAAMIAPETKITVRTKVKRYFTGNKLTRAYEKRTVELTGKQRIYQGLKTAYRLSRRNGVCRSVGGFLARVQKAGAKA